MNASNNAPGYDADGDGIPNVFEYYFDTSPTNTASSRVASGTSVTVGSETYPAITFIRSKDTVGLTLLPQASSSVFSASLGTTVESVVDIGNGLEEVTVRFSVSDAVQPTQFLRIQLSVP